ncbi:sigma-70 family RNA polymerase sigma factor [Paraclostridium bifermentans]|uniref:sigma-70 family RNA polymerase sigma factor n=1 Tax=Paraclostridium bifermentans TaxID=1490 RepID=UPI0024BAE6EF|nr:sigma-70 family RNA polymerase sigma factor [Paraclostridium bifermentans]
MNVDYLMCLLKGYINEDKELLKDGADKILKKLKKRDQERLLDLFKKENIRIVDHFKQTVEESKSGNQSKKEISPRQVKPRISNKNISISNEQLCVMYQRGDETALDLLAIKNEALLTDRTSKYMNMYNHKLEFEDVKQYAFLGMIRAVQGFDSSKGFKFSTYAINWIDQSIRRNIMEYGFTVRVPVHIFEKINRLRRAINVNCFESDIELVNYLRINEDYSEKESYEIIHLYRNVLRLSSLDVPIGENEDGSMLEVMVAKEDYNIENIIIENDLKEAIDTVLSYLTEREEEIIRLRFGLDDGIPKTLEQIGQRYGVTRERIRQIEAKALNKLKHPNRLKYIKSFTEAI